MIGAPEVFVGTPGEGKESAGSLQSAGAAGQNASARSYLGTAPCVACGERVTVDEPNCCWKRGRLIWMPVSQLEPGDLICADRDKPPGWKVLSVTEGVALTHPHWKYGWETEIVRIPGAHAPTRRVWRAHDCFYVPRTVACQNFACDLHRRELAPGRIICAECWPLQMAAIVGAAA